MSAVQNLIIGVIAVLIGVVLIGPIVGQVDRMTRKATCAVGGSVVPISGSGSHTPVGTDVPVTVSSKFGTNTYAAGTLCATPAALAALPSSGEWPPAQDDNVYELSKVTGSPTTAAVVGGIMGYGHESSRSLALLIPLVFVGGILTIPIYLVCARVKNGGE